MTKNQKVDLLLEFADSLFPDAKCELFYNQDYELAIAVMLSAQTTDKAVNLVTKELFSNYLSLKSLDEAPLNDIENIIKSIGLYKNKARNIKGIARVLLEDFNGVLPSDKDELQTLPGIGNKSAGVIRCEIFKIPDLPVDTHIIRITNRLGLANKSDTPLDIEMTLKKLIPEERWIKTHHQLIHFGRYFCLAKNPHCEDCKLRDICNKN
ncbi:MAG: endonuclease III [Bacilli bacterium]|nr:endonuclease III [Bacilli bacterium]